jgi:hypothetical protein
MEIAKHFVGAPAADHADPVAVDSGAKESRGAARACGAGGDVGRKVRGVWIDHEGSADTRCEAPGSDVAEGRARGGGPERIERGGERGGERAEGADPLDEAEYGANVRVPRAAMANLLAANAVFLPGESESHKGRGEEVSERTGEWGNGASANPHGEVADAE